MKISGIIITLNEEKNILRCIRSLKQVCEEVIVVDSFSTDLTEEICKAESCVWVQHPFEGYGQQKNYANALAKYDYILSLDADEALSQELLESIQAEKQLPKPRADAYSSNRLNQIAGKWTKHGGFYPDRKIRLWKKGAAQWNTLIVHEETVLNDGYTLVHLNGDIHHYAYSTYHDFENTAWKYNQMKAITYKEKNKQISYSKYLSRRGFKFFRSFVIKSGFSLGLHGYKVACILSRVERALYDELNKPSKSC